MKTVTFTVKRGKGKALGQYLRQIILTSFESWRPIGFSVNRPGSNELYIKDGNVVESVRDITATLGVVSFEPKTDIKDKDLIVETFTLTPENSVLYVKDLVGKYLQVTGSKATENKILLSMLKGKDGERVEPLEFKIYFRFSNGKYNPGENLSFIQNSSGSQQEVFSVKAMSSLHTIMSKVTYEVVPDGYDSEKLIFKAESKFGDEIELLKQGIATAIEGVKALVIE